MTWKEWLRVDEANLIIDRCAAYIARKMISSGLIQEYDAEDLTSEIWIFCNNNAEKWENQKPFAVLYAQGLDHVARWIINRFILQVMGGARRFQQSPAKYLYSRLRVSLSSAKGTIRTYADRVGTYYTCCQSLPWSKENSFGSSDLGNASWIFPSNVSEKNIYEKDVIVDLAQFFWRQIREKTGKDLWVPVRELAHYVALFLPIRENHDTVSIYAPIDADQETTLGETLKDPSAISPERQVILEDLRRKAEKCALRLDSDERKVLALYHGENQSLEEMAKSMGYATASGVSYLLTKSYHRIRNFCKPIPGLSPPDIDRELFTRFMEYVIMFCKIHSADRN